MRKNSPFPWLSALSSCRGRRTKEGKCVSERESEEKQKFFAPFTFLSLRKKHFGPRASTPAMSHRKFERTFPIIGASSRSSPRSGSRKNRARARPRQGDRLIEVVAFFD